MKSLVIFSWIIILATGLLAQVELKDVATGHWASEAIYNLVKRGVTQGYPDGTFRGTKSISRYEIAVFLSKLAKSLSVRSSSEEKLIAELKAEVALIKYRENKRVTEAKFSGGFESQARVSVGNSSGAKLGYRANFALTRKLDQDSSLRIRFDTTDAGFNSESLRDFSTKLIDVESKFKIGRIFYKVNLGPGVVVHTEKDGLFPSDNYTIYIRPKSAIKASTWVGKMGLAMSYVTRQVESSGKIGVHELTAKLDYDYGGVLVYFRPRYLFKIDGPRDVLAELGLDFKGCQYWETNLLLGVGDFQAGTSGMYLKVIEKIKDPWQTGTNVTFRFDKIGSKYRYDDLDEYEFCYLNNFNRLILDGTVDIGLKIKQKLRNKLSLEWKGDYVTTGSYQYGAAYPETYFLWQAGLLFNLSSQISLNTFYRSYSVPSGMAQFGDAVPTVSEMVGIGINSSF